MKKLIVLLCLIFIPALTASDTSTYVLAVSGQDGGGACSTDTVNVSQESGATALGLATYAHGQEFQVSQNGQLSAIELYFSTAGGDYEIRWGTSSDLSSPDETLTGTISATGYHKFVFTNKTAVTTSTTYYFGIMETVGTLAVYRDNTDPYANGRLIYGSTGSWDLNQVSAGTDMVFRVYLCD